MSRLKLSLPLGRPTALDERTLRQCMAATREPQSGRPVEKAERICGKTGDIQGHTAGLIKHRRWRLGLRSVVERK